MKQLIKKVIPRQLIAEIKARYEKLDILMIRFFSKNGFLASIYYAFFSQQFYREHRSVLLGRVAYEASLNRITNSSILLRRNIHRIEKGLIMQPRREVFAEGYIRETVDCFKKAIASDSLCSSEKEWASDVLQKYFSVVSHTTVIENAKNTFLDATLDEATGNSVPYVHADLPTCPLDYDQLLTLFKRRRSVRWFEEKTVDMSLINKAVEAATYAPSACNRQPYEYHVVTDKNLASEVANCAMGTVGFAENIPCMIAIVGNLDAYPAERDRHIIYIDGALASMQLMLAFETLGLSSCSINWPDIELREKALMKKLKLAYHQRIVMLMAVGYAKPDGGIPFSQKKGSNLLVKEVK
ncbi:nitroreductase family protein [Shewanella waksmanii]|uniref:nitroreductase family protein n=1 Tax=Shewanella waksmanii TaxID=213783 RepID=UPI0004919D18|nr:nitroreductase family protein [Shewanella waksmanii]